VLVPKQVGRVVGALDDMVISLYAHGMSVRDIIHHLEQSYGTQLSHETVSPITDQVCSEMLRGDGTRKTARSPMSSDGPRGRAFRASARGVPGGRASCRGMSACS
jgi:hypothetical protein